MLFSLRFVARELLCPFIGRGEEAAVWPLQKWSWWPQKCGVYWLSLQQWWHIFGPNSGLESLERIPKFCSI
jgi:hypothetical protein